MSRKITIAPTATAAGFKQLTQQQQRYAVDRLDAIYERRLHAAFAKLPDIGAEPDLSDNEKIDLIAAGRAKLLPRAKLRSSTYLPAAYEFPEHGRKLAAWSRKNRALTAAKERLRDVLQFDRRAINDKIMLGVDGTTALKLIEDFSAGK